MDWPVKGPADKTGKFGPDVFCDCIIQFMRRHWSEPFFGYYSAVLTHIPVVPTPGNCGQRLSPREQFARMVRYADRIVGRLAHALDQLGLRRNRIIFITADNGTDCRSDQGAPQQLSSRLHGRMSDEGIYSLREHGINVPLSINCPGRVLCSKERDELLDATDILPTLAELAGAELPGGVKIGGRSFAPCLLGRDSRQRWRP